MLGFLNYLNFEQICKLLLFTSMNVENVSFKIKRNITLLYILLHVYCINVVVYLLYKVEIIEI